MDLWNYVRVGRYSLPEPTRTAAPANNLLAQEASAVTYNWDTGTLFVTGDGGRSITEVSTTGQLVSTMTLALGSGPQGTEFYDPEGLTYIGNGQFVMTEERDRNLVLFTYAAGTTIGRADTQTVDLGTFSPNEGLEGLSFDPLTGGFIVVKEINPQGIFQTTVDFDAGTASNGSATTENSVDLFDPALLGVIDLGDVFALSNLPDLDGTAEGERLLVLSQESAKILEVDRDGVIYSTLSITGDPDDALGVSAMQHEGVTMDRDGNIYVVNENGGGDIDHPELWVYAPSAVPNEAPTAIALTNTITSLPENTSTTTRVLVANITVTDDGLGNNVLAVTGADAEFFEVDNTGLYIKAGVSLDFETRTQYDVTVTVDDAGLGASPDASADYTLTVTDIVDETATSPILITEVAPWSSGNSAIGADWFELTNTGTAAIDLTGWKMDDSSRGFATAVDLSGITTIKSGESVIFFESTDLPTTRQAFLDTWFDGQAPFGLQFGSYSGGGVGLSTGGDEVNIYDSIGTLQASVAFGTAATGPFTTFDNALGVNNGPIAQQSVLGRYGAFAAPGGDDGAAQEIGSPGSIGRLFVSEVAPWSSGDSPVGADWFELTNSTPFALDITGWKVDDSSESPAGAVALNGITSIAAGESVIFLETDDLAAASQLFIDTWFGGTAPAGLQFGSYTGSGIGFSTDGDAVNIYDTSNTIRASVAFGESPSGPFATFDNSDGLNRETLAQLSSAGVRGAFIAAQDAAATGSPGTVGQLVISEVAPWSSGDSPVGADWFEVTNTSPFAVDLTGWKVDDGSASFASAVALSGVTTIAAGESVIFLETDDLAATSQLFIDTWFGGNAPAGLQIGGYSGSGIGLSTGGDAVNLYDADGALKAAVTFGASPAGPFTTFDNAAGLDDAEITTASQAGVNGAFEAAGDADAIGSPGAVSAANASPAAGDDSVVSAAGKPVTIAVLANDSDPEGDAFTVTEVSDAASGSVFINVDGSVTYTPNLGFTGTDSFTYTVRDAAGGGDTATVNVEVAAPASGLYFSEVAPWASGDSPVGSDWFEITNNSGTAVDVTGWKLDDSSATFASAVALTGITSIAAGESVIFFEADDFAATRQAFVDTWFGGNAPAGLQFGSYTGSGIGLSTGGDELNLYDGAGTLQASVAFGDSPSGPFATFDNASAFDGVTLANLSQVGAGGAFVAPNDSDATGSPGSAGIPTVLNNRLRGDYDGDGRDDIVWSNVDGSLTNWLAQANGAFAANDGNALTALDADTRIVAAGDFDGDTRDDLILLADDGTVTKWLGQADGGFEADTASTLPTAPAGSQVVGSGDFDGDGNQDLLWRATDGTLSSWLGEAGGGFAVDDPAARTHVTNFWAVVGVADFNGDGNDDLLWRSATGNLSNWLGQDDGGFEVNDVNAFAAVPTDWHIVGTGDFDGDGMADILSRNDDGWLSNWLGETDGGFEVNDAAAETLIETAWLVSGIGDFNGDGRDDILWRNDESGAVSTWVGRGDGGYIVNDTASLTGPITSAWQIQLDNTAVI